MNRKQSFFSPPVVGWLMFDWASQPFFTLITTFVFAPYFSTSIAATAAQGQSLWGYATAAAGLIIAVLSPVLGATADADGRRKPWIAIFSLMIICGSSLLWLGAPGQPEMIPIVLFAFALAMVGAEFAIVFTNAMMPDLVSREYLGRLSGYGWAIGYAGGFISLIIVLGFMTANPETGLTLLGSEPILNLNPQFGEGDRASGPFSAIWYIIFVLPLFLFTPDGEKKSNLANSLKYGMSSWVHAYNRLKGNRQMLAYLIANMAYKDGLVALFAFGGIYAAGILGWGTIQIGLFGILILIGSIAGSTIGGVMDDKFGAKRVILISLSILIFCCLGIVSVDQTHILFIIPVNPPDQSGTLFSTAPEIIYLFLGVLIGAISGPLQSASRTLLIGLAPRNEITQFFGLFAMSGKLTSFLAPLSVAIVTGVTSSQRIGISVIIAFFVIGMILMIRLKQQSDV